MRAIETWLAAAASDEDPRAVLQIAADDLEERGEDAWAEQLRHEADMIRFPGKVGENWFVQTVTLYYVGRVVEIGAGYIQMEDASWVHWTGRLSLLTRLRKFHGNFGTRCLRVEPVGPVYIANASIVAFFPPPWELPKEAVE